MKRFTYLLIMFVCCISCIATNGDKENKTKTNQLQLQEDIQRFYTRFTERIIEADLKGQNLISEHKQDVLRQYLLYDSEALKIATAPFPVINLLDMLVFIKLNRIVINDYWIPYVYGKSGQTVYEAFHDAEKDLEIIASKVMTQLQLSQLDEFIARWRAENPDVIRVEKVRMSDFTKYANGKKKKGKPFIIVDTESAVEAVDQMVLVANRGIFLAQQLPLIVRLHARLGTQEILSDTVTSFQSVPKLMQEINGTNNLIENLKGLVQEADNLANDSQDLLKLVPKHFNGKTDVNYALTQLNTILDKTILLVGQLRSEHTVNKKIINELKGEFKNLIWFMAFVVGLVAIFISISWWTGSYLSKRLTSKLMKRSQQ